MNETRTGRDGRWVTLAQTFAAIGVVAAFAVAAPVALAGAKDEQGKRSEISELHQLAVAQSLYTSEHDGDIPTSTFTLVKGGYVNPDVCYSPNDIYSQGLANSIDEKLGLVSSHYQDLVTPYRNSYMGFREYDFPYAWMKKYVLENPAGGWLVSLTMSDRLKNKRGAAGFTGPYQRLALDGSVKLRQHEPVGIVQGGIPAKAEHDIFLFLDGSNEWKTKFISGSR